MKILSKPTVTLEQCKEWAKKKKATKTYQDIVPILYDMAIKYGINPCVMVVQCAKETGYCRFGGVLDASFYNPCGLKTPRGGDCKDPEAHTRFSSWEEGIEAQAQHLALYSGAKGFPLSNPIDPRHFPYIKGKCKTVASLSGNWAGKGYGEALEEMCKEIESIKIKKKKMTDSEKLEAIKNILEM